METYKELRERLARVIEQKDRYRKALCGIMEAVQDGMYNGLFDSGYRVKDFNGKCSKGMSYRQVRWSGCPHVHESCLQGCPLDFQMRKLLKRRNEAFNVEDEDDAAMIPFSIDEIPTYNHKANTYHVSDAWFARRMMRFLMVYRCGGDNKSLGGNESAGDAFIRLVGFGCDTVGYGKAWREFLELKEIYDTYKKQGIEDGEIRKLFKQEEMQKRVSLFPKMLEHAARVYSRGLEVEKAIGKNPKRGLKWIVLLSALLVSEFDFHREYPGADTGVYGDAFSVLCILCKKMVGLGGKGRLDILEFLNGEDVNGSFKSYRKRK